MEPPQIVVAAHTTGTRLSPDIESLYSSYSGPFHSHLHSRYIYTHSECSSSLSSISVLERIAAARARPVSSYMRIGGMLIIIAMSSGVCAIHGIFESDYEVQFAQYFEEGLERSRTASLIGALQLATFIGVHGTNLSLLISRRLDARVSILVGAVLCGGGMLAAGFANAVWQLCLAQGIMVGLGAALSSGAAAAAIGIAGLPTTVERYVEKSAAIWTAAGIGGGALTLGARKLVVVGSTESALRWLALIVLVGQCVGALLMGRVSFALATLDAQVSDMDNPKRSRTPLTNRISVFTLASWAFLYMSVFVPLIFIPGYASTQLANSSALSGASHLSTICFASSVGSLIPISSRLPQMVASLAPRVLLALSLWCLWLPSADSWAMTYAFCAVFGLALGATAAQWQDGDGCLVLALSCAAAVLIGVPVAGWLFVAVGSGDYYVPTITFSAAASLLAALAWAVGQGKQT
ncbi:hypothetical protein LPJ53_001168 [Coemansia erecta]|uniref:MFS general substrate transporter n=1 Tax=Coemansia erecta TaxID=147472 RepID=A0A9W7Y5J3_9FUNG|nr:hypothetical protein LPJ53_001168 [Coemansia erecta]